MRIKARRQRLKTPPKRGETQMVLKKRRKKLKKKKKPLPKRNIR